MQEWSSENAYADIQKREGLEDGEYWPIGEGPEDYREVSAQSEELCDQVRDTVFTSVLRKYQLGHLADFFEGDRDRFEEIRERSRASIFGPLP